MATPWQRSPRGYNNSSYPSYYPQRRIDGSTHYAQPQNNKEANPAAAQIRAGWGWGASPETASDEIKAGWAAKGAPGQAVARQPNPQQPAQAGQPAGNNGARNPSDVMQDYRAGKMSAHDASNALQMISRNAPSYAQNAMNAQMQRNSQPQPPVQPQQSAQPAQPGTPAPQSGPQNPYSGGNAAARWNDMQNHKNGYEGHPGMMNGYSTGQVVGQPSQQSQPMRVNNPSYMSITPTQNGGASLNSAYGTGSVHGGPAAGNTYIGDETGNRTGQFAGPATKTGQ